MARRTAYTSARSVDSIPDADEVAPHELVLYRKDGKITGILFHCPCNCGDFHYLPQRDTDVRPTWEITQAQDSTVTVSPSVRRVGGCQSHFWITANTVVWC